MIKWLILCDLWPAFGQYLVVDKGLSAAEGAAEGNRLLEVARSPGAMRVLRKRYDQAAIGRLHAFLGQPPALSVDLVRELSPFTTNLTGIYD